MKKLTTYLVLTVLLATTGCKLLKLSPYREGKHFKYPNLKDYEGSWQHISKTDTFKITLKLVTREVPDAIPMASFDTLEGEYYFTGVGSSLSRDDSEKYGLHLGNFLHPKKKRGPISIHFHDFFKKKTGKAILEIIKGKEDHLTWTLKNEEKPIFNMSGWSPEFSVPTNVILKKVD